MARKILAPLLTTTRLVAIRRCTDDGHEWLDACTLAPNGDMCREAADQVDALIPDWARMNPVVRIARVTLTEEPAA